MTLRPTPKLLYDARRGKEVLLTDHAATWTLFGTDGTRYAYDTSTNRAYPVVSGGAEGDPAPATTGDPTGGEGESKDPKPDDTSTDKDDEKTLPQSKVNEIVSREVSKATRGKLDPTELGFGSRKELEEFLEAKRKEDEDKKTEDQKALDEARQEAADAAKKEVLSKANARLLKAEFLIQAAKHEVEFSEDAFALAQTLDDWKHVEVDDDSGVVSGLDDDFFKSLKEAKPFLWGSSGDGQGGKTKPGSINAGAGSGKGGENREEELRKLYPGLGSGVAS